VFRLPSPFNFPLALSAGMSSARWWPAMRWSISGGGHTLDRIKLYEVYRDAGIPAGAFNVLFGHGTEIGDPLWQHPESTGGVHRLQNDRAPDPSWHLRALDQAGAARLGGRRGDRDGHADVDAAAEGVMRSAFSLQKQKLQRDIPVYVTGGSAAVRRGAAAKTAAMKMGDPTERDVYFGQ